MAGGITDAVVFPLLGRVVELDKWRYLMKESTDIDFLRLVGGASSCADEGGSTSVEAPDEEFADMDELAVI